MAIALSDIRNYLDFGPDGLRVKRLTEIDLVKMYAVKTYQADATRRSFCISLHDKNKALTMLLKLTREQRSLGTLTNGL